MNFSKALITGFLLLPLRFLGQEGSHPQSILNKMTPRHQNVAGTKLYMIPPHDFSQASTFNGYQNNESGASIMVSEIPEPISEATKDFTTEELHLKGIDLEEKAEITLNGTPAQLYKVRQMAYGMNYLKYILAFGDENKTILINGTYPEEHDKLEDEIKESLLSVIYDETIRINPFASAPFEVDISKSKFKFASALSGMFLYTPDGKIPTQAADKSSFMAGNSLGPIAVDNAQQYSIDRLQKMALENLTFESIKPVVIDNLQGYEIMAKGKVKSSGEEQFLYQVMLFSNNRYYLMFGTADKDFDKNLQEFKAVSRTFKRK